MPLKAAHPPLPLPGGEAPRPPRRRCCGRWALCLAVVGALVAVGVAAGVLVKVLRDREHAALATPAARGSGGSSAAPASAAGTQGKGEADPKAAFYPEAQSLLEESVFLPLGAEALLVGAQSGAGMPFAFEGPGPCRAITMLRNISLDLSAAATGCRGAQCAITLNVVLPQPVSCSAGSSVAPPFTTLLLVPGFTCTPFMYRSWLERLASWGYAVLTYGEGWLAGRWERAAMAAVVPTPLPAHPSPAHADRPLGGLYQPAAEVEVAYFDAIVHGWRNAANNTQAGGRFAGLFSNGPVGIIGHSMGGGEQLSGGFLLASPALAARQGSRKACAAHVHLRTSCFAPTSVP